MKEKKDLLFLFLTFFSSCIINQDPKFIRGNNLGVKRALTFFWTSRPGLQTKGAQTGDLIQQEP